MSKKDENRDEELSKEQWLRYAQKKQLPDDPPFEDPFSRRAIQGLQYVENAEEAQLSLQRLEARIDARTDAGRTPRRLSTTTPWLKIAAALLLLLIPASVLWFNSKPIPSPTAFDQHFTTVPSNIPLTGPLREGSAGLDLKRQAILSYESNAFDTANDEFEQYLTMAPDDIAMRFYYGISLLAAGQAHKAVDQLEQIQRQSEVAPYRIPARWYLGMAHLKLNERQEALTHLRAVANQNTSSHYREKAAAVLRDLDSED